MMNTKLFLGIWLLLAVLSACTKEDRPEPSGLGRNWFVIQDKPGELNHLIYTVYQETGIPILINDTLGKEERGVDVYGKPIIHYERFVIGYSVEGQKQNAELVLSSDTASMLEMVKALRDLVIPYLPVRSDERPYSFLIGDTLYMTEYGYNATSGLKRGAAYAYKDMMGIVVGRGADIKNMSEQQKRWWAGMVLAINRGNTMYADFPDEMAKFYNVSLKMGTITYHQVSATCNIETGVKSTNPNYDWESEEMGFLEYVVDGLVMRVPGILYKTCPSKEIDAANYMAAVYVWTEEQFTTLYADWPKCIEKYRIMKDIIERYKMTGK